MVRRRNLCGSKGCATNVCSLRLSYGLVGPKPSGDHGCPDDGARRPARRAHRHLRVDRRGPGPPRPGDGRVPRRVGDPSGSGFSSFGQWASVDLGLSSRSASSLVNVAAEVADMPTVRAPWEAGELSTNKVTTIVGVATAESEANWYAMGLRIPPPSCHASRPRTGATSATRPSGPRRALGLRQGGAVRGTLAHPRRRPHRVARRAAHRRRRGGPRRIGIDHGASTTRHNHQVRRRRIRRQRR